MRNRLKLIATGVAIASLAFAFGVGLNAGAVETDGTVEVCVSQFNGNMRVNLHAAGCSDSEILYEFEGERFQSEGGR